MCKPYVCEACGEPCEVVPVDSGYGWTAYGSNLRNDSRMGLASSCCETDFRDVTDAEFLAATVEAIAERRAVEARAEEELDEWRSVEERRAWEEAEQTRDRPEVDRIQAAKAAEASETA